MELTEKEFEEIDQEMRQLLDKFGVEIIIRSDLTFIKKQDGEETPKTDV